MTNEQHVPENIKLLTLYVPPDKQVNQEWLELVTSHLPQDTSIQIVENSEVSLNTVGFDLRTFDKLYLTHELYNHLEDRC